MTILDCVVLQYGYMSQFQMVSGILWIINSFSFKVEHEIQFSLINHELIINELLNIFNPSLNELKEFQYSHIYFLIGKVSL